MRQLMICVLGLAVVCGQSACGTQPPPPPRDEPDITEVSTEGENLGRVFDNSVEWSTLPTAGLPEIRHSMDLRPFGRWPDGAFMLANHLDVHGMPVAALYKFDPDAERWSALGFVGDFRAGIELWRVSPMRWVLIRKGWGIGGNVPVQVAVVGTDLPQLLSAELPCRSETSSPVNPARGDGSWLFACGSLDGEHETRLYFAPDSIEHSLVPAP